MRKRFRRLGVSEGLKLEGKPKEANILETILCRELLNDEQNDCQLRSFDI
jgi:hypothetical protein